MKKISILFVVVLISSYSQLASADFNRVGIQNEWPITTGGYNFNVETISNFTINKATFYEKDKKLEFLINSLPKNNIAEIQIPHNLINGNITAYLNGQQINPKVQQNDRISFVTVTFDNKLNNATMDIIGTTYLPEFSSVIILVTVMAFVVMLFSTKFRFYK